MTIELNRREASRVHFPWWTFTGVLILTASFCVGLVGSVLHSYRLNGPTQQRYLRFEELRGVILRLDEVLTMATLLKTPGAKVVATPTRGPTKPFQRI